MRASAEAISYFPSNASALIRAYSASGSAISWERSGTETKIFVDIRIINKQKNTPVHKSGLRIDLIFRRRSAGLKGFTI